MLLLPYDKVIFNSPLSHEELLDELIGVIGKPKMFYGKGWWVKEYPKNLKPYAGSLTRSKISIYRVLTNYRSAFNPLITGRIKPTSNGTQVKLHFYLHPLVMIFMATWLGFACFFLVVTIQITLSRGNTDGLGFAALFFLGGYLLMMIGYKYEVRKSTRFFHTLIQTGKTVKLENPSL